MPFKITIFLWNSKSYFCIGNTIFGVGSTKIGVPNTEIDPGKYIKMIQKPETMHTGYVVCKRPLKWWKFKDVTKPSFCLARKWRNVTSRDVNKGDSTKFKNVTRHYFKLEPFQRFHPRSRSKQTWQCWWTDLKQKWWKFNFNKAPIF